LHINRELLASDVLVKIIIKPAEVVGIPSAAVVSQVSSHEGCLCGRRLSYTRLYDKYAQNKDKSYKAEPFSGNHLPPFIIRRNIAYLDNSRLDKLYILWRGLKLSGVN
jgi:hypothetical protein